MFTYDPTFDPNGPRRVEVQSWCDANKISRDQIYYEKSTKKYCKEQQAQVVEWERVNLRGSAELMCWLTTVDHGKWIVNKFWLAQLKGSR
jgi:hypothetical protein